MSLSSDGIRLIVTTQSGSESYAANELAALGLRPAAWLEDGVGLFAGGEAALAALCRRPPIFVRHVFGVQTMLPLAGGGTDAVYDDLVRAAVSLAPRLALDESFAVQIRAAQPGAGAGSPLASLKGEIARAATAELEALGYRQDARHPARVLSIYCAETAVYLGVSPAADNLSEWNGGMHRFATRPEQISRAEFKLLEALDVFGVALPPSGVALDLGAAPGGWTRLLRERGLRVVAVDPAELDPRLAGDPLVEHRRTLAQIYLYDAGVFDVMVNDMRMDALASAGLMAGAAGHLALGGVAIMTLKLPKAGQQKAANRALARLRAAYTVAGARQLFNNRSEITVCLRARA